jgi:tetratricopeptide (TPR) repeat protein
MQSLTPVAFRRLGGLFLPPDFVRAFALPAFIFLQIAFTSLQAQEQGWGDTWTQTRSDRERERHDALLQIAQAVKAKNYPEAERQLDDFVRRSPQNVDARMTRAAVHALMHRYDAALQDCAEAIALLQKQEPGALGLIYEDRAEIYRAMGKPAESRADLERALRVDKTNTKFNNELAWLLATSPDASVRDGHLAVHYAQAANRLSGGHDPALLDTLAAAEAEAGDFESAAREERKALALAKSKKVKGGEKRLSLYEKHQPYREIANENFGRE